MSVQRTTFVLGALAVMLVDAGCRATPTSSSTTRAEDSPTGSATLSFAGGPDSSSGTSSAAGGGDAATSSLMMWRARMRAHDVHGAALRDAVAGADLEAAKREANVLANLSLGVERVEPLWREKLDAMNAAAKVIVGAKDVVEASRGLAALARSCGDCHAVVGSSSHIVVDVVSEPPGGRYTDISARMRRHQWAAARLWDGLVAPSNNAWKAGAAALANAPLEPELVTPGKTPVLAIDALALAVHTLGEKAVSADAIVDRQSIYGELMATCATCHTRLGREPPPSQGNKRNINPKR